MIISFLVAKTCQNTRRWTRCFACCRARRAAKEAKEAPAQPAPAKVKVEVKKFVKIGRPGYKGELVAWLLNGAVIASHTLMASLQVWSVLTYTIILQWRSRGTQKQDNNLYFSRYVCKISHLSLLWQLKIERCEYSKEGWRFSCWPDRLSRSCWRNWTQAPFHVCLWTAHRAPWSSMAVPAFCCRTIWNYCL